ncbi:putative membrane protein [Bradyrhizobium sp. USDA 4449]
MARSPPGISPKSLLHPGFISAGGTLLIAALVTDLMYWETSNWQWANSSAWLITAGLVLALVAAIALIVDFVAGRAGRIDWIAFLLVAVAALLSFLNVFIHSRDAWTSVVPQGISLSAIVTILLLMAAATGWKVTTVRAPAIGERP